MEQCEPVLLVEYAGHKFYVEYVDSTVTGNLFRVHTRNGTIHNLTTGYTDTIENARQEVIKEFKEYLDEICN